MIFFAEASNEEGLVFENTEHKRTPGYRKYSKVHAPQPQTCTNVEVLDTKPVKS